MKKMGTSKGFPDLLLMLPITGITGDVDAYQLAAIEMKRKKGGVVSPEQKEWLEMMELAGIPCAVCRGADEAIKQVESWLKEIAG